MKITPLFTLLFSLAAIPAFSASVHMIGDMPSSEMGLCLGLTDKNADKRGEPQKVSRKRIAAVLKRLEEMKLDSARFLKPLKFDLVGSGRSNQYGGNRLVLSMATLDQNNNLMVLPVSTGTIAHEIGHWVGHTMEIRGKNAYEAFRTSAFRSCHGFDGYSTHLRNGTPHHNDLNETFAEVFSGYITAPNFLKTACPAGYEFMRDQVFRGEISLCPDPDKKKPIPLPHARPWDAPAAPVLYLNPEQNVRSITPTAADGEHPISVLLLRGSFNN
jgi:hypothetical protein